MENICKVVFNRLLKNYRVIFFINVVIIDYKYIHNNIKKKNTTKLETYCI